VFLDCTNASLYLWHIFVLGHRVESDLHIGQVSVHRFELAGRP
jgi:hypothetical protein